MADPSAAEADRSEEFAQRIRDAVKHRQPLRIVAGGTKDTLVGRRCEGTPFVVREHQGIVRYNPKELVMTARAGTPIAWLRAVAAEQGQTLPGEPPEFHGRGTLGGTLASGLLGPARPWQGSLRDAVLGIRLINGRGEILRFGGEVIKNVAGYDLSRFQAGGLGCFGLILDVSLRLIPTPRERRYIALPCTLRDAITRMHRLSVAPLPLTGASWFEDSLQLRFEGSTSALDAVSRRLGPGEDGTPDFWEDLREWRLPPQARESMPWVLDVAPARAASTEHPATLVDWAGARRWHPGTLSADRAQLLAGVGGHAIRYGAGAEDADAIPAPPAANRMLLRRLKKAADPEAVLNPGRMFPWL